MIIRTVTYRHGRHNKRVFIKLTTAKKRYNVISVAGVEYPNDSRKLSPNSVANAKAEKATSMYVCEMTNPWSVCDIFQWPSS